MLLLCYISSSSSSRSRSKVVCWKVAYPDLVWTDKAAKVGLACEVSFASNTVCETKAKRSVNSLLNCDGGEVCTYEPSFLAHGLVVLDTHPRPRRKLGRPNKPHRTLPLVCTAA